MSTTKRRSRRRRDDRDALKLAWDAGEPPPPEAYLPEHHDTLIELVYFSGPWDGRTYSWHDHPHRTEWAEALRREK